jgi:hypothetical protein
MISISHHIVLVHSNETFSILQNSRQKGSVQIYKREQLLNITDDLCIVPLVRGQNGKCPFKEIPPSTECKLLTYGTILVKAISKSITMSSTCGMNQKDLRGNYLIIFHNCSVIIQNMLFENLELNFKHPNILPLELLQIEETHLDKHYNISHIQKLNIENRHHLELLKSYHYSSTGVIFILITIIIATLTYRQRKLVSTFFKRSPRRASLGEGVVNNQPAFHIEPVTRNTLIGSSSTRKIPSIIPTTTVTIPTSTQHKTTGQQNTIQH